MDLPGLYAALIQWIGDGTGLSDTILHIHAGMAVLLVARVATRRSLGTLVPWSVVALAELANEVLDRLHYGSWRWADTLPDIVNTMLWPSVICLAVRLRPLVLRDRDAAGRPPPHPTITIP